MTTQPSEHLDNTVLAALPSDAQAFLASRLLKKPVMSGEVLHEPGAPLHSCDLSAQRDRLDAGNSAGRAQR